MSDKEIKELVTALDGLFGACDNLYAICAEQLDRKDARVTEASKALSKAREAIANLCTLTGTEP